MKKAGISIFALATVFAFAACGNKASADNAATPETQQAAEAVADGTTFEGKNFSLVYPKELTETYASETTVNAEDKSENYCHLDATFNEMGPALSELSLYANNWVAMKEADGCKLNKPAIDGKVLTIKAVKNDETELHFVVMKEDRIGVAGSLKFKSENDAKYEPVLRSIIASVKFK